MATNRDIVSTRKLNKKNKARLGRRGDTKIREVAGRDSHVNALEAYLIDVNRKAGEEYTKRVGSGTINPLTGMPEYHTEESQQHKHTDENDPNSSYLLPAPTTTGFKIGYVAEDKGITGRQSYETLSDMDEGMLESYLQGEFGMGGDSMQYIEGFKQEPFDFYREQQELITGEIDPETGLPIDPTTGRAGKTKEFTEEGLLASKEAAGREAEVATAGIGETYRGARESLGREFTAGSRGIGRGMTQARAGAATAAAQSGFARSGTVTGALGQQMKALTQDYGQLQKGRTQGMAGAGRRADIGLAGVAAGQKTAEATYNLGMKEATADYDFSIAGADLDFRQAEYLEKKRQLDELYDDVGAIPT